MKTLYIKFQIILKYHIFKVEISAEHSETVKLKIEESFFPVFVSAFKDQY